MPEQKPFFGPELERDLSVGDYVQVSCYYGDPDGGSWHLSSENSFPAQVVGCAVPTLETDRAYVLPDWDNDTRELPKKEYPYLGPVSVHTQPRTVEVETQDIEEPIRKVAVRYILSLASPAS